MLISSYFEKRNRRKSRMAILKAVRSADLQRYFSYPQANIEKFNSLDAIRFSKKRPNLELFYIKGEKDMPLIYFVHGLGATWKFLFEGMLLMAELGFSVLAHSRRAEAMNRQNQNPDTDFSFDMLIDDMVAITKEVKAERIEIIASSFGGILALKLAERLPKKVNSVTTIGSFLDFPWHLGHELIFDLLKNMKFRKIPARNLGPFAPPLKFVKKRSVEVLDFVLAEYEKLHQPGLLAYLALLKTMRFAERVPRSKARKFFIHGDQDHLIPLSAYEQLVDRYPECQSLVLIDTGHGPFLSEPYKVYREFLRFIAE